MRKIHIVGNWKMNGSLMMVDAFVDEFLGHLPEGWNKHQYLPDLWNTDRTRVVICPPLPYLHVLGEKLKDSGIHLGAQKFHPKSDGAFTGEVSTSMLLDLGVKVCIIGHSERRHLFGESDAYISENLHALVAAGIDPILCVGETLAERESEQQEAVVKRQIQEAVKGSPGGKTGGRASDPETEKRDPLSTEDAKKLTVAYEPVWAIGTGRTATPQQANEMHAHIRGLLRDSFPRKVADNIKILYGGSVTPDNAEELLHQPEINGALVGGASLKPQSFAAIISQALN